MRGPKQRRDELTWGCQLWTEKSADPFCSDITAIWDLRHRRRVTGPPPSSSSSSSGLSAVTFVPDWNSLIVSVLLFSSPSGLCPLPTCLDASFDIYPHGCQTKLGLFVSDRRGDVDLWDRQLAKWRRRQRLGGKQNTGETNAPSGRFSSIHQLPG